MTFCSRGNLSSRVALVCIPILLSVSAVAQDLVVMKPGADGHVLTYEGRIGSIDLDRGELRIREQTSTDATLILRIEEIETVTFRSGTPNDLRRRLWKEVREQRGTTKEEGEGDGNTGRGLLDESDPDSVEEIQPATRAEQARISELLLKLGTAEREQAIAQLREIGRKATPQLENALRSPVDRVREGAVQLLGEFREFAMMHQLIDLTSDRYEGVRREAVIALGRLDPSEPHIYECLLDRMRREKGLPTVLRPLAEILSEVGKDNPDVVNQLKRDYIRASKANAVYYYAALARLGHRESGTYLGRELEAYLESSRSLVDDVFLASCLAGVSDKRGLALRYLIEQLRESREAERDAQIIGALEDLVPGKDFGYSEANDDFERNRARRRWLDWWNGSAEAPEREE